VPCLLGLQSVRRLTWMILRMEMYLDLSYSLVRACAETMMFLGCSSLLITSSTASHRTHYAVTAKGVQCTGYDEAASTGCGVLVLIVQGVCALY